MRLGRGTTGSMALPLLRVSLLRRGSSCAVGNGGRPGVPPLRRKTDRERWFGKLRRSYGIGPTAILGAAGPQRAGRNRTQALLILRAGNFLPAPRDNPRNGGPGVRRIWTRSVHPEPSPGDPLVSFPSLGKKLAARRRRNSPAYNKCSPKPAPSSGPFGATFPPGGRLRKGRRRNFSAPIHLPITHSNIENKTTPERRYAP